MPPKCGRAEITAISEEELKAFFTALYSKERHFAYKVLFTLMLTAACRIGEITALTWDSVDFGEGRIQICRHFVQDESGVYVKEGSKTKAGVRWLYLDDRMMDMLAVYRDFYLNEMRKYGSKWAGTNAVFTISHRPGDYIRPYTVREWLMRFLKTNGFRHIRLHQFRHTSVSLQLQEGISIPDIAKRAGHSRPNVTLSVYAHTMRINDKHLSEAATKILPMLSVQN
ncbi:MAG: site-specific integrase [Lachnospiraceae bacterium]|nr:site-specific integrase [Lachnospiraceae bacterium]